MRVLHRKVEAPTDCAYLPERLSKLEVQIADRVGPAELDELLANGWRHFGPFFFQPVCDGCRECVAIRVLVGQFEPSRSQRRVLRRGKQYQRIVGPPRTDTARLELYARWHANREELRGWSGSTLAAERYRLEFGFPHSFAREAAFYDRESRRIVAVGLFDEAAESLNAIFCFYDPAHAHASLGTLNVLTLIDDARRLGKPYVYLGFRVEGCPSLIYKQSFEPHELRLDGEWRRAPST